VPTGGGGLASGISIWMNDEFPECEVIPVQHRSSSSLNEALESGGPENVEPPDTMAEGIATGRIGDRTYSVLEKYSRSPLLVGDDQIIESILWLLEHEKILAEGAGAAGISALHQFPGQLPDGPGCVIVSGGNLDIMETIHFLERGMRTRGQLIRLEAELPDRPGALSDLSGIIGDYGGNIQFIHHDRTDRTVAARSARVQVEISLADKEARKEMLKKLKDRGYNPRSLDDK
ncbi:MAG: pyridoxal-phosphate dependent enzyme, partial [bacterium]